MPLSIECPQCGKSRLVLSDEGKLCRSCTKIRLDMAKRVNMVCNVYAEIIAIVNQLDKFIAGSETHDSIKHIKHKFELLRETLSVRADELTLIMLEAKVKSQNKVA